MEGAQERRGVAAIDYIASLAKGLAVLECFDPERQRINASMAAQKAGITRAAARRYLLTLADLGYLESDGRFYWLSPKVLRMAGSYLSSARLPRVIQPTLQRLAAERDHSFSVAVLDGDEVVVIGRSGPGKLLAYGLHLGARLPAHATSTGRVLLAGLPPDRFEAWLAQTELRRLTPKTVVEPAAFRAVIDTVRDEDHCVATEEHELGVIAIAVPVRDLKGNTLAALNVVKPMTARPPPQELAELLALLRSAASDLRGLV